RRSTSSAVCSPISRDASRPQNPSPRDVAKKSAPSRLCRRLSCAQHSTEIPSTVPGPPTPAGANKSARKFATQQSVDLAIKSVCDIMRRGNVASALQYVPELTWILFLRILDETEDREAAEAEAVGARYTFSLAKPYRWKDWAAPDADNKRKQLESAANKAFITFCNTELIPHLRRLRDKPHATPRQKVIS